MVSWSWISTSGSRQAARTFKLFLALSATSLTPSSEHQNHNLELHHSLESLWEKSTYHLFP